MIQIFCLLLAALVLVKATFYSSHGMESFWWAVLALIILGAVFPGRVKNNEED